MGPPQITPQAAIFQALTPLVAPRKTNNQCHLAIVHNFAFGDASDDFQNFFFEGVFSHIQTLKNLLLFHKSNEFLLEVFYRKQIIRSNFHNFYSISSGYVTLPF